MQVFGSLASLLSELDVLLSFADLASSCPTPYTRPEITPSVTNYYLFLAVESSILISSWKMLQRLLLTNRMKEILYYKEAGILVLKLRTG